MQPTLDSLKVRDLFGPLYWPSLVVALLLLALAYIAEHFANLYAFIYMARPTSVHVGDLLLDGLPALDLSLIIIDAALVSIVCGTFFILSRPRYILFSLKALALFVIVRAFFISLTHVGMPPENLLPGSGFFDGIYSYLNFQLGLFFSGHTGLPFLMGLVFWRDRSARLIFFSLSFVFAIAVLLAHIHYSIDVFAAPFMAYGIFKIAQYFFPRDYALLP